MLWIISGTSLDSFNGEEPRKWFPLRMWGELWCHCGVPLQAVHPETESCMSLFCADEEHATVHRTHFPPLRAPFADQM